MDESPAVLLIKRRSDVGSKGKVCVRPLMRRVALHA
jgi:hypothetical protein